MCHLTPETTASFIYATHSLRFARVTNDDVVISALLEHSKNSLETVIFDKSIRWLPYGGVRQHSLQGFRKLANIELPQSQLVDITEHKESPLEGDAGPSADVKMDPYGITERTMDRISLLAFLPP